MDKKLVVYERPKNIVSESIRTLRTNLSFSFIDNDVKSIMITSSIPNEGKSFISSNLAVAFAMDNSKVLLVDCDLRKGTQNKIFNIEKTEGLSNLLLDDIKNYKNYITKTKIKNLDVLISGITPPNPSELLGSETAKKLFKTLRSHYDIIIIDCPPVSSLSDSLVITSIADEALIVARQNITPIDDLQETKKNLENSGIKIAGIIMNGYEVKKDRYSYGKYYSKYYE